MEPKKMSREEYAARTEALNEPPFTGQELIKEIQPLIEDYFFGTFELDGDTLVCAFVNGQRFRLKAEEIKIADDE